MGSGLNIERDINLNSASPTEPTAPEGAAPEAPEFEPNQRELAALDRINAEWGRDAAILGDYARRAAAEIGIDDDFAMRRHMHTLGQEGAIQRLADMGQGLEALGDMTPFQARAEIRRLSSNPKDPLWADYQRGDEAAKQRMLALHARAAKE